MSVGSFLRRLRRRGPSGEAVELKPLEQLALAHLLKAGSASLAEIEGVVDGRGPVLRPEPGEVIAALVQKGLAQARIELDEGAGRTLYVATDKGRRLRKRLAEDPRSLMVFYV